MIPIADVLRDIATSIGSLAVNIVDWEDIESWRARFGWSTRALDAPHTSHKPETAVDTSQYPKPVINTPGLRTAEQQETRERVVLEMPESGSDSHRFELLTSQPSAQPIDNIKSETSIFSGKMTYPETAAPQTDHAIRIQGEDEENQTVSETKENAHGEQEATNEETHIAQPLTSHTTLSKLLVLIALALAIFVITVDESIVAVAIPAISDEFGSLTHLSWYICSSKLAASALYVVYQR